MRRFDQNFNCYFDSMSVFFFINDLLPPMHQFASIALDIYTLREGNQNALLVDSISEFYFLGFSLFFFLFFSILFLQSPKPSSSHHSKSCISFHINSWNIHGNFICEISFPLDSVKCAALASKEHLFWPHKFKPHNTNMTPFDLFLIRIPIIFVDIFQPSTNPFSLIANFDHFLIKLFRRYKI